MFRLKLVNPAFVYTLIWVVVLLLAMLRLTNNLPPLNGLAIFLVVSNIITAWLAYFICDGLFSSNQTVTGQLSLDKHLTILRKLTRNLLILWCIGTGFE